MSCFYNRRRPFLITLRTLDDINGGNNMLKKNIITGLLVRNFDEALDFYTKKLGFVVVEDFPMGTDRWLTITAPGNQDWFSHCTKRGMKQRRRWWASKWAVIRFWVSPPMIVLETMNV